MRPGGASDRMLQTAQEIGREECSVLTVMTRAVLYSQLWQGGGQMKSWPCLARWWHRCVKCVQFWKPKSMRPKLQEISKCLMLWVLRSAAKESQWYERGWFFNQATNMPWHNKEQKRCSLRNTLDVSRTPKQKKRRWWWWESWWWRSWGEVCISARHPLYFSDPSPLSSSSPSGPWPHSPNNVRLWCLAS